MFLDKVYETTATLGTGPLSLLGATGDGNRTFVSVAGSGQPVFYVCATNDGATFEMGWGVVTSGPPDTLTRNFIASTTGALINWPVGTKYVFSAPIGAVLASALRGNKGATRPPWLQAGGTWIKDNATPWVVYAFDGTQDIPLGYLNSTTNEWLPLAYSEDPGSAEGPVSDEYRNSASPADGDLVAARTQSGNSDNGTKRVLTKEWTRFDTVADGAETAVRGISAIVAGTLTKVVEFGKRVVFSRAVDFAKSADVATASSCDIWNTTGNLVTLTGNVQVDDFGTTGLTPGASRTLLIAGTPIIKNNANSKMGGSDIQAAPGDILEVVADSTTTVLLKTYTPAGQKTAGVPSGAEMHWPGDTAPAGWIFEYHQVLSQTVYAGIYAVVGTKYNIGGEGAGNFRMPDGRGVVFIGKDDMGGVAAGLITVAGSGIDGTVLGATGGQETVTLTINQIPSHDHDLPYPGPTGGGTTGVVLGGGNNANKVAVKGGGLPHTNTQPSSVRNVIMKI